MIRRIPAEAWIAIFDFIEGSTIRAADTRRSATSHRMNSSDNMQRRPGFARVDPFGAESRVAFRMKLEDNQPQALEG